MIVLLWIILSPLALVVGLAVCFCFGVGFVVMMNIFKAGRNPEVDASNYIGRLLGFVQLSRHIPKLMRACFVFPYGTPTQQMPLNLPGDHYQLVRPPRTEPIAGARLVTITRPLLNMNRQDLMEQLDFRPDDGKVDGRKAPDYDAF